MAKYVSCCKLQEANQVHSFLPGGQVLIELEICYVALLVLKVERPKFLPISLRACCMYTLGGWTRHDLGSSSKVTRFHR